MGRRKVAFGRLQLRQKRLCARGLVCAAWVVPLRRLCSDHACCLPHSAKQDGLCCVPFLFRRVEIAIHALSRRWRGYLPWRVHFGFVRFFMAISTGLPGCGDAGTGNGAGGAAFVRFCAAALAL